jgi:SHS2 domain-containing protein
MTPIAWLDHAADVGFRATGGTLEEVFCEAARALFSLMSDVRTIRPRVKHAVCVRAESRDQLLVEWLSELLAQRELSGLVFGQFDVRIDGDESGGYTAEGVVGGEPLDPNRHRLGTEVKGISYLGLDVGQENDEWFAQCVVDV